MVDAVVLFAVPKYAIDSFFCDGPFRTLCTSTQIVAKMP